MATIRKSGIVVSNIGDGAMSCGPVTVVGSRNWITPAAEMEQLYFPQLDWIIDAVHERILPLPGYTPVTVQTTGDVMRKNRMGV
jgi:2-oxoisovalerate dehydrogenase E1 component